MYVLFVISVYFYYSFYFDFVHLQLKYLFSIIVFIFRSALRQNLHFSFFIVFAS